MRAGTDPNGERRKLASRSPAERPPVSWRVVRLELGLLTVFSAVWLLAVLALFGILPLAGTLSLDLYRLFSLAGILGWVTGNVYVVRLRSLPGRRWRKRLLLAYLLGPPGTLYLLRALESSALQAAMPFVPLYSLAVYGIFFLVPVTLRQTGRSPSP